MIFSVFLSTILRFYRLSVTAPRTAILKKNLDSSTRDFQIPQLNIISRLTVEGSLSFKNFKINNKYQAIQYRRRNRATNLSLNFKGKLKHNLFVSPKIPTLVVFSGFSCRLHIFNCLWSCSFCKNMVLVLC
jgi:hypothetical protein